MDFNKLCKTLQGRIFSPQPIVAHIKPKPDFANFGKNVLFYWALGAGVPLLIAILRLMLQNQLTLADFITNPDFYLVFVAFATMTIGDILRFFTTSNRGYSLLTFVNAFCSFLICIAVYFAASSGAQISLTVYAFLIFLNISLTIFIAYSMYMHIFPRFTTYNNTRG